MPTADDRNQTSSGNAESAAWSTASGESVPKTQTPPGDTPATDERPPSTGGHDVGPEITSDGTDPESPVAGKAKPPSTAAEVADADAPPPGPHDT